MTELFWSNVRKIYKDEGLGRVLLTVKKNGTTIIRIDVHGLTYRAAIVFVRNIINCFRGECILNVIHGYRHGHVLKDLFLDQYNIISLRFESSTPEIQNPGSTIIRVSRIA